MSPRRATHFLLLRQKKVSKEKATPSLRPLRGAKGQTCVGAVAGCAVELALRWRAPLGQLRRVRSRSTRAPTRVPPRNRTAAGAASRGGAVEHPNSRTSIRAIALLGPVSRAQAPRAAQTGPSEAKARVDVLLPLPLWMRRGAQRAGWHVCRRTHMLRCQARRSCLSGARQRAASSAAHPVREHHRLPRRAALGSQTAGSPFLWSLSFGEAKESDSHAGRLPASALNTGTRSDQRTGPGLDKLSPSGWGESEL